MFIPHTRNDCLPGPGHVLGAGQQGSSDGNDVMMAVVVVVVTQRKREEAEADFLTTVL